ncbi:phenylacetate--CoA ligase family protein [Candidatus Enterococcus ikei]|uniref:Uncharacterized protein n=1 Tax=Candidatus Enterococcus ikei TaxID=2815326 RepID=A0ABS3GX13_9ENTE|nr:hypothetical protein [Enterococcus sp. DIV0869a]MBO0439014.1 hypothetical protein [Enterococcus sp. DIV0869a]
MNLDNFEKVKKILEFTYQNSSFYNDKYKGHDINSINTFEDFSKLPLLTAEEITLNSKEMIPSTVRPYRVSSSSGTLGKPKVIYRDEKDTDRGISKLVELLKMAKVTCSDSIMIGQPFEMAHFGYLVFEAARILKIQSIPIGISISNEAFLESILNFKPTVICTSLSRVLVIIQMLKVRNINELPFVKSVILAGEPVTKEGIDLIQNYFNVYPFNFYGSEETDGLGGDCKQHKGIHFFDDVFYLELLDIPGVAPTKKGNKIGEAVITSLYQIGTPLIRYKLGDIIEIEASNCSCGESYPLVHSIGRAGDAFNIFDGVTILAYQIEKLLKEKLGEIENYQIYISTIVPGLEEIKVKIKLTETPENVSVLENDVQNCLWQSSEDLNSAKEAGALRFRVEINRSEIYVTQRGKTKRIIDLRKEKEETT